MNAEAKALWLAALRSGEYNQGHGLLRSARDEYCCLGVLCEVAVRQGVIPPAQRNDEYVYGRIRRSGTLPAEVTEWAGINDMGELPRIVTIPRDGDSDLHITNLVDLNDDARYTFAQIADVIEEQL